MQEKYRILLVDDDPGDAWMITYLAKHVKPAQFEFVGAKTLKEAIEKSKEESFDIVIADLTLPDSSGMDTLKHLVQDVPEIPIVVVTGMDDDAIGLKAIHMGAQDFIPKDHIDEFVLERSVRFSIERFALVKHLRDMTMTDELTGLKNRRGFYSLCKQAFDLSNRTLRSCVLLFGDVDGLKHINDARGHEVGDAVLKTVSGVLSKTTRGSDIVSRLGGDEFAILMMDARVEHAQLLINRIQTALTNTPAVAEGVSAALSLGRALYDPVLPQKLEALLAQADKDMYQNKQVK